MNNTGIFIGDIWSFIIWLCFCGMTRSDDLGIDVRSMMMSECGASTSTVLGSMSWMFLNSTAIQYQRQSGSDILLCFIICFLFYYNMFILLSTRQLSHQTNKTNRSTSVIKCKQCKTNKQHKHHLRLGFIMSSSCCDSFPDIHYYSWLHTSSEQI